MSQKATKAPVAPSLGRKALHSRLPMRIPSRSPTPTSRPPWPSRTPSASPSPQPSASARDPSPFRSGDFSKPERKKSSKAERLAEAAAEAALIATERDSMQSLVETQYGKLKQQLSKMEAEIGVSEEEYIRSTWAHGNVLRGWDGFGRRVDRAEKSANSSSSGLATGAPKHRKSRPADRIFSLTSATSTFRAQNPEAVIQKRQTSQKKKKRR